MNFWPDVVTKPVTVEADADEVEVCDAVLDAVLLDVTVEVVDADEELAAPGRHSKQLC